MQSIPSAQSAMSAGSPSDSQSCRAEAGQLVGWRALSVCILVGLGLFWTWDQVPVVRSAWDYLDHATFYALNGSLAWSQAWFYFWLFAGSRLSDLVPGLVMLGFYATLLSGRSGIQRLTWGLQLGWMLVFLWFWQHYPADWLLIQRYSPSLVLEPFIDIERVLRWVPDVKSASYDSFPGDHASVLVFFAAVFFFLLRRRHSTAFLLLTPLFCLPRLVSGGHWLTDVTVGGVACGLVGAAIFLGLRNVYLLMAHK